jgi:hypothetical protein
MTSKNRILLDELNSLYEQTNSKNINNNLVDADINTIVNHNDNSKDDENISNKMMIKINTNKFN